MLNASVVTAAIAKTSQSIPPTGLWIDFVATLNIDFVYLWTVDKTFISLGLHSTLQFSDHHDHVWPALAHSEFLWLTRIRFLVKNTTVMHAKEGNNSLHDVKQCLCKHNSPAIN